MPKNGQLADEIPSASVELITVNQATDAVGNAVEMMGVDTGLQRRGHGVLGFKS
jgi:hypothetical protein